MKKSISVILLFVIPFTGFSQEELLDKAYLKCQYDYTYMKDTLEQSTFDDLIYLQIGRNISKSYSYYTFQSDSLRKTSDGDRIWEEIFNRSLEDLKKHRNRSKWMNSFPHRRSTTFVYKNYPAGKMTVTDAITSDYVIYQDELNSQDWQILDSTKTILGYECQKAQCNFRGRQWTAWFTPDIPVNDGPWKFGGLPGLIMEVYDMGKQYHFNIIGLEKTDDEPILFSKPILKSDKYRQIDRKEFLKVQMRRLSTQASFMGAETGVSFGNDEPVYRDLIERDYK